MSENPDEKESEPRLSRQELFADFVRLGVPDYPRWVRYVSLGVTSLTVGVSMLVIGSIRLYEGTIVGGAVMSVFALISLPIGLRLRAVERSDHLLTPHLPGKSSRSVSHPKRRS